MSKAWRSGVMLTLLLTACSSGAPKLDPTVGVDSPAQVNAKLGLSYLQHGNYEVAEAKLQRALKQDPRLGEAYHYLAELYRRTDREDLAKDNYRKALKYSPDDMSLHNNYGVYLCEQGDYAEAVEVLVRVANSRHYNRPDEAFANAGMCAMRIPDEKLAEKYLRTALSINKVLPGALYQMAVLSYQQHKYLHARAFIERYSSVARQSAQSLLLGVRVELKLGDHKAVDNYATQLGRDFPDAEETVELEKLLHPE